MSEYRLSKDDAIHIVGSSRGSQIKFCKDNYWYKIDESGPEGLAEYLSSLLLENSNLKPDEFVKYEMCSVNYGDKLYKGCRSRNFLNDGELFLSYSKIHEIMTGGCLSEDIISLENPFERIEYIKNIIGEFSGLDISDQISKTLTFDMVTLNTDRHLNNIGIIMDRNYQNARNAPIFDNGAAFLSNYTKYPPDISVKDIDVHSNVFGQPFSADLEYQANCAGIYNFDFDFDAVKKIINDNKHLFNSRAGQILLNQIDIYKDTPGLSKSALSLSVKMESTWKTYFHDTPKEQRNGIEWNSEKLRPAVFEDMYLAQCRKEGKEPLKEISDHFWKNCVEIQEYTPKYCIKDQGIER